MNGNPRGVRCETCSQSLSCHTGGTITALTPNLVVITYVKVKEFHMRIRSQRNGARQYLSLVARAPQLLQIKSTHTYWCQTKRWLHLKVRYQGQLRKVKSPYPCLHLPTVSTILPESALISKDKHIEYQLENLTSLVNGDLVLLERKYWVLPNLELRERLIDMCLVDC